MLDLAQLYVTHVTRLTSCQHDSVHPHVVFPFVFSGLAVKYLTSATFNHISNTNLWKCIPEFLAPLQTVVHCG